MFCFSLCDMQISKETVCPTHLTSKAPIGVVLLCQRCFWSNLATNLAHKSTPNCEFFNKQGWEDLA
jgi:hypothetical protein